MKINIIKTKNLITPALEAYIETKIGQLAKLVRHFEERGEVALSFEVSRTTQHHKKGEVYMAAADLRLPNKVLRAEEYAEDIRVAIDRARDTLHLEIEKYKTKFLKPRKAGGKIR
jgi:ribosomal subunit interface protein